MKTLYQRLMEGKVGMLKIGFDLEDFSVDFDVADTALAAESHVLTIRYRDYQNGEPVVEHFTKEQICESLYSPQTESWFIPDATSCGELIGRLKLYSIRCVKA